MISKIGEMISGDSLVAWLLIAVIVAYFIYKEWPEFRKRVSAKAVQDQKEETSDKTVEERLERIEADVNEIKLKQKRYQKMVEDSLEEREIIMEALLGALGGLQELGANGPTKEAENKIRVYLNKQAHRNEEGEV